MLVRQMSSPKHSTEWSRGDWAKVIVGLIFSRDARKAVGLAVDQWLATPEPRTEPPLVDPDWFSKAPPCEEGDELCVDPWPCIVHDRTPTKGTP